jgi:GTP-binding protein HflX
VSHKPTLQVLNKIDLLPPGTAIEPGAMPVSGLKAEGLERLVQAIDAALTRDPLEEREFRIPQSEGQVIAGLERGATVVRQRFEGNLVYLTAVGPHSLLERYARFQSRQAHA